MFAKGLEKNATGALIRYINSHMPKWLWVLVLKKMVAYRPQASFLDHAEDTGTVRPIGQPSLEKTKTLIEALLKKQNQMTASSPLPTSTVSSHPAVV